MSSNSLRFEQKLKLPKRSDFAIRNGYILSVDAEIGNLDGADLHVCNGMIIAIGVGLDAVTAIEGVA